MDAMHVVSRLTVIVDEDAHWRHRPVYSEIVHRAHAAGLAGASVFHGIEGYGASSRIHTDRILSLTENLPVLVILVDRTERIEAFLPRIRELMGTGVAMVDEVRLLPPE